MMFMKNSKFFAAALALAAVVACNKENTTTENNVFESDEAYLNVKIAYSDASETRGTSADPSFYYGTAVENKVESADFFFYNADGSFAMSASKDDAVWSPNGTDESTTNNVEEVGNGIILLKDLKSTAYPVYMSVVLNAPDAMAEALNGLSISAAYNYVVSAVATEGTSTDWTKFVMTSTSYNNDNASTGYFCIKLSGNNFQETEEGAKDDKNAVTAYVERLAAKVNVALSESIAATGKIGSFDVDGTTKDLYFKVLGWGLNATTKDSYTFKNIDPDWTLKFSSDLSWNDALNKRSYWGKSTNYGLTATSTPAAFYPQNYEAMDEVKATLTPTLNYTSWNELAVALKSSAYCRENTNSVDVLKNVNFSGAATSVLVKAQVTEADGTPVNLVNYLKSLYTENGYKNKVLSAYEVNHSGAKIYKGAVSTSASYEGISADDLKVVAGFDGNVTLAAKDFDGVGMTYYIYDGTNYTATTVADVTSRLNEGDKKATEANFYNNGMMYYNIPVEHLGQNTVKYGDSAFNASVAEGDYGVVRNHFYNITINSIKNLGHSVYDPDEKIVPNDDDLKDYYVGAKVNVLSWKVVKQSVNL